MPLRIGILGITGKVGGLCAAACAGPDLALVGGAGRPGTAKPAPAGVARFPDAASLAAACDVVIDFTHADLAVPHAEAVAAARCAWVLGTSGIGAEGRAAIAAAAQVVPIVQAANFSPGMNLLLALAEHLARLLPDEAYDAEIVDLFHRRKVDAPSGTAIALGEAVARGRGVALDAVEEIGRAGHVGARGPAAIGFSSLRGGNGAGENTLLFTGRAEQTVLTHRVTNPMVYARGALQAARWVRGRAPGLYGMADVVAGEAP